MKMENNIANYFVSTDLIEEKIDKLKMHNEELNFFSHDAEQLTRNMDEKVILLEAINAIREMRGIIMDMIENSKNMNISIKGSLVAIQEIK